ncbi:hypothetical protein PLICRDRAFT_118324 [Plicaturopsis crispa FD-325 SS-3]|uniref:ubiquitinyl hydrolase 1 n=1 Tax=Plicaturopsis crispa FD-325 SS-3 TaxID=944288 RepID=A0A0C9SQV1_PLICR|nr:hypothetical protein PLICRDRAFT_118324 [Plicaturopsis crispa FD-325 SS-3]
MLELSGLTPSQLYELNQQMLNDVVPVRELIDTIASMDVLRAEYENGSASFVAQIDFLVASGYTGIRRTRGDGDCYYRSLAFAYVERLLQESHPAESAARALSNLNAKLPMLDAAGFQKMVYEDFYEYLTSIIQQIITPDPSTGQKLTTRILLERFQSAEVSNSVVVFLRLLTSAQIRTDPDSYAPFLFHPELGIQMEPREFCESFVEAVGKEADHVQIIALSRALEINVHIAYLDGRDTNGRVEFVEFNNAPGADPLILLYRPGHYDILVKAPR